MGLVLNIEISGEVTNIQSVAEYKGVQEKSTEVDFSIYSSWLIKRENGKLQLLLAPMLFGCTFFNPWIM